MSDTILIHGFAAGLNASIFRTAKGTDAGFRGFHNLIERGVAKPFRWDERHDVAFWNALSPLTYLNVYNHERETVHDEKTHASLQTFLRDERPRVIVCHSMGCALLLAHLERRALPDSVRHVVLVQADIPSSTTIPKIAGATWHNLYCPWDPTLFASALYHRTMRAGLTGIRGGNIRNRLTPLFGWNPHTVSICDPNTAKWVTGLD